MSGTVADLSVDGCSINEAIPEMVSVMCSVTANTAAFAKGMRRARDSITRFIMASMPVKWKHARSRGENQQGRFRGSGRRDRRR